MGSEEKQNRFHTKLFDIKNKYLFQYFVAFSASLIPLSCGIAISWTTPMLPKLIAKSSPIPITNNDALWLALIFVIAALVATIPGGWMMDKYGRKTTLLVGIIPLMVGWIIAGVANSLFLLFTARIFTGVTLGIGFSVLPMYLGEIASDRIRGSVTSLLIVMTQVGALYVLAIGPYVSMGDMAWIALIPPIIFIPTFMCCPESPYYLVHKGRYGDARRSLCQLKGHDSVDAEFRKIETAIKKSRENQGKFREFIGKRNRNSVVIIFTLAAMQHLCGGAVIINHSQLMLRQIAIDITESEANIIQIAIQIASSISGVILIDIWGRKPLLLVAAIGTAIPSTIIGFYVFFDRHGENGNVEWFPFSMLMIYVVCYCMGMLTVPFAILSEIFVNHLKAMAAGMCTVFGAIMAVGALLVYKMFSDLSMSYMSFWVFAGFSYLFIPFVLCGMPETRGKPLDIILEEINERTARSSYKVNK